MDDGAVRPLERLMDELVRLTRACHDRLADIKPEELADYVERRAIVVEELKSISAEQTDYARYHETIRQVLAWDRDIAAKLEAFRQEAGDKLIGLRQSREGRKAYMFDGPVDSLFVDRRQ